MAGLRVDLEIKGVDEQVRKLEGMGHLATQQLWYGMKKLTAIAEKKVASDMSAVAARNLSSMMGAGGGGQPLAPANPRTPFKVMTHEVYIRGELDVVGVIQSRVKRYMATAQTGRGPGKRPPARAIRAWVSEVMGISDPKENRIVAARLRRAIAEQGITGTPTLEKSRDELRAVVDQVMGEALERVTEGLVVK